MAVLESAQSLRSNDAEPRGRALSVVSLLFGLALIVTVFLVASRRSEEREFAQLLERSQPAWLLLGLGLQALTYLADAAIWKRVAARAGVRCSLTALAGLVLSKLFIDQAIPVGGMSGTLVIVRGMERRGAPRGVAMAGVVVDLTSYYAAYALALVAALVFLARRGGLPAWVLVPGLLFTLLAVSVVSLVQLLGRGLASRLPRWVRRLRLLAPVLDASDQIQPELIGGAGLMLGSVLLQAAIILLDAGTVWAMLRAVGQHARPDGVFASFALSSLARTLGVIPGGIGTFEAASVGTLGLMGVPTPAALAATLLFRGLSFYLPLVPGLLLARREARAARR